MTRVYRCPCVFSRTLSSSLPSYAFARSSSTSISMSTNIYFVPSSKSSADSRRSNVFIVATNSMSRTTETTYHFSGDENEDFDKIVRK